MCGEMRGEWVELTFRYHRRSRSNIPMILFPVMTNMPKEEHERQEDDR
jgi:hypothetical protein